MHVLRFEILKTRKGVTEGKLVRTVVEIQMIPRSDLAYSTTNVYSKGSSWHKLVVYTTHPYHLAKAKPPT